MYKFDNFIFCSKEMESKGYDKIWDKNKKKIEKILNEKYLNYEVIDFDQMQYAFQNVEWSHNEVHLLFKNI